ncbi:MULTISPECIES: hypothetical protein [unclassified Bradyrhizobium]|uniref:hypothetical protein n=1 Tax=unclassified Bradyrhizobium TaxID=2631580 RepID=UPI00048F4056|nr:MULTISPECIES: hypothetical protein [unclassified Bradyrhizobium]QIG93629.1 hypothetical protein G6P99_14710 [Bradyrhizobium sp. 6(2017)]
MLAGQRYPKLLAPFGGGFARLEHHALTDSMQTGLERAEAALSGRRHSLLSLRRHGVGTIDAGAIPPNDTGDRAKPSIPEQADQHPCDHRRGRTPILAVKSCMRVRSRVGRATLRARRRRRGSAPSARISVGFVHPYENED